MTTEVNVSNNPGSTTMLKIGCSADSLRFLHDSK